MKRRQISLLTFQILLGLVISCKSGSIKTTHQTIDQDSISNMAYPSEQTKINPDEAIIIVLINNITKLDKGQTISCKLIKIEQRGFGFSSNLIEGDNVIIYNTTKSQINGINKEVKWLINETESLGQNDKTFALIKVFKR